MTASWRRFAWPLGVSLAAHALLGAWLLWKPTKPPAPRPAPAAVSLRLIGVPAAGTPADVVAAATPRPVVPPRKPVPKTPPKAPKAPRAEPDPLPTEITEASTAAVPAAPPAAPVPAPVTGVAFGPPRLGLPFGTSARTTWTPRPTQALAMPPTAAGPAPQATPALLRQQSADGLARRVAEWTAPDNLAAARCRVSAEDSIDASAQCDPPSFAAALAERLQSLREAWAAYRRLAPEAPASVDVAYADGRFSLSTPAR
jgi:hypothetical protein